MRYHITYITRDGRTEVARIGGANRSQAMANAAATLGVPRSAIQSAVCIQTKPTTR